LVSSCSPFDPSHICTLPSELTLEGATAANAHLIAQTQAQSVEISDDVSYKRSMHYRAASLASSAGRFATG
jgi:hypothetical protein